MSDDETATVTLELTEQQFDDALRAINTGEIRLDEEGHASRSNALTNVWAQLYRGGKGTFRDAEE